jgi:hypothetical protein
MYSKLETVTRATSYPTLPHPRPPLLVQIQAIPRHLLICHTVVYDSCNYRHDTHSRGPYARPARVVKKTA